MGKAAKKKLTTAKGVNIHDAKTHLSALIAKVERSGEEVTLCRAGKPVAKIIRIAKRVRPKAGYMKGLVSYTPDAFDPMTPEEIALWEDGPIEPTEQVEPT